MLLHKKKMVLGTILWVWEFRRSLFAPYMVLLIKFYRETSRTGRVVRANNSVRAKRVWHSVVRLYFNIYWFSKQTMQALISLHKCAGWSGLALSANCIRPLLSIAQQMLKWFSKKKCCDTIHVYIFRLLYTRKPGTRGCQKFKWWSLEDFVTSD